MSKMIKSTGKIKFSTFTNTSYMIPRGCVNDLSTNFKVTVVGCASPNFSFLKIDQGIRLMLAPRSHKALSKTAFPIAHGICEAT